MSEIGEVALLIIFTIKVHGSSAHIVVLRRGIGWCFTSLTLRNVHRPMSMWACEDLIASNMVRCPHSEEPEGYRRSNKSYE